MHGDGRHLTTLAGRPRESLGGLHKRLLLAQMLVKGLPSFVGNRLRTYVLRAAGFHIGRGTMMWGLPTIIGSGAIHTRLTIGEYCGFNVGCLLDVEAPIQIGNHVSFGHDVMILTSTYERGDGAQRAGDVRRAPVVIGDGAWIAARSVVMPGVTIGAGAVIGATVIVSADVPPNTLVTGPQKISLARWR
ncbi:MAG: acyltransferase [Chloroflexales bacterium]|nr:acyltransferase [Chloroflexales bacterium]